MKLLLLPLLLVGAGAGWFGLRPSADATPLPTPAAAPLTECRVTVERTGPDTCLITCYEADGSIRCQREIACDGACDKACDAPCEKALANSCDKPCAPHGTCSR